VKVKVRSRYLIVSSILNFKLILHRSDRTASSVKIVCQNKNTNKRKKSCLKFLIFDLEF